MPNADSRPAFQQPIQPADSYMAEVYRKYGFEAGATLELIELKATELLEDPRTAIAGAQLVLNRRVDARDAEVIPIIITPGFSGAERFGLLLMQREVEASPTYQAEKAKLGK